MPIYINRIPEYPAMSNSEMIFEVTSSLYTSSSFQYVMDIRNECDELVATIKQSPNPEGNAIFDVGQIMRQYLSTDDIWKINGVYGGGELRRGFFSKQTYTAGNFKFLFGEEFRPDPTSSINLYNGMPETMADDYLLRWTDPAILGRPAVSFNIQTPSTNLYRHVINGLDEDNSDSVPNNPWWELKDKYDPIDAPYAITSASINDTRCLTDFDRNNQYVTINDYHTISIINGNYDGSPTQAQDVATVTWFIYDDTNSLIDVFTAPNITPNSLDGEGLGPRSSSLEYWSDVNSIDYCVTTNEHGEAEGIQTTWTQLGHMGVGPANLRAGGFNLDTEYPNWSYYEVYVTPSIYDPSNPTNNLQFEGEFCIQNNIWFDKLTFHRQEVCGQTQTRFAWKNEYGVWDYFNCFAAENKVENVERSTWKQSHVNYASANAITAFDKRKRPGTRTLQNKISETVTTYTNWLTQQQADQLEELFRSAVVYIQDGDNFLPVEIVTASITKRTNIRSQKNFQYEIQYRLSNQKRSR